MSDDAQFGNLTWLYIDFIEDYAHSLPFMDTSYIVSFTIVLAITIFGIPLNLWFLFAIILSTEMRTRMRNKVICNTLIVHLMETTVLSPVMLDELAGLINHDYKTMNCLATQFFTCFYHILDFVANWLLVVLTCCFLAHIINFEPKFNKIWVKIVTWVSLILPWVFALLFVPLTIHKFYETFTYLQSCILIEYDTLSVYKSLDTIVPLLLTSLGLVAAAIFNRKRYMQWRTSENMESQFLDGGSQIDPIQAFVASLVASVVCDFYHMIVSIKPDLLASLGIKTEMILYATFKSVTLGRVIIVPLLYLLFPDVRARIKTWRPWQRSPQDTGLVVTYERDVS